MNNQKNTIRYKYLLGKYRVPRLYQKTPNTDFLGRKRIVRECINQLELNEKARREHSWQGWGRFHSTFLVYVLSTPFRSASLLSYSTVMDMHSSMILFILLLLLGISFFFFPIPFSSPYYPRSSSNCKGSLQCPFCHHTCETSTCQRGSSCS